MNHTVVSPEKLKELEEKAAKWDELGEKIAKCYPDENNENTNSDKNNEGCDLITIGEMAAIAYGWL